MTRLAILGASTRSATASARRAGFEPIAADLFCDADLASIAKASRVSPYPSGFVAWLCSVKPDAWMYTGALENHAGLVDELAAIAPLWGNSGDVLRRVRSPLELAAVLGSAGLLFPETRTNADGLPTDGTWLRKTYDGASGSGVREFVGRVEHVETHHPPAVGLAGLDPTYYQRRIVGMPCAALFVARDDAPALLGCTRQLIGEPWLGGHNFQFAGSIGPLPLSKRALTSVTRIGNVLAREFRLLGLFGVDFILDSNDDVWTIEVNPRYTASTEVIERLTEVQSVALHAAACRQTAIQSAIHRPKSATGKATLFARELITIAPEFFTWSFGEATRTPWPTLADISPAGTAIEPHRPILTLFASGSTADQVEQSLRERAYELEQRLYNP